MSLESETQLQSLARKKEAAISNRGILKQRANSKNGSKSKVFFYLVCLLFCVALSCFMQPARLRTLKTPFTKWFQETIHPLIFVDLNRLNTLLLQITMYGKKLRVMITKIHNNF